MPKGGTEGWAYGITGLEDAEACEVHTWEWCDTKEDAIARCLSEMEDGGKGFVAPARYPKASEFVALEDVLEYAEEHAYDEISFEEKLFEIGGEGDGEAASGRFAAWLDAEVEVAFWVAEPDKAEEVHDGTPPAA